MRRRGIVTLGVLAGIVVAFATLRRQLGLEFDPESMHQVVADMGIWAPLVFVGIVTFRVPLGLPSAIVLVGGGAVFGALAGTLYGALGILCSGIFMFFAARATGPDAILARLPRMRSFAELAGSPVGALVLILGSGYPMGPATLFHLVAGVAGMAFVTFVVAAGIGAAMRSAVYTFFGSRLIEGDLSALLEPTLVMGVVLAVPLLFPRSRAWLLRSLRRGAPSGPADAESLPQS